MQTHELTKLRMGHLEASTLAASAAPPLAHVLLLGNAYGVLPYQVRVAEELAKRGFTPYWFPFTGQTGTQGKLSSGSGVEDAKVALEYLIEHAKDAPIQILSHCVGSCSRWDGWLGILVSDEAPRASSSTDCCSILVEDGRLPSRCLPKRGSKARPGTPIGTTTGLGDIAALEIPVRFCHARDRTNLSSCPEEELEQAVQAAKNPQLEWFEQRCDKRLENVPEFMKRYESWDEGAQLS